MMESTDDKGELKKPQDEEKPLSQDVSQALRSVTTRALEFLSTASNQTLGACLVGLGASTYLVLGRAGLVLIGFVGGVVLQATWDTQNYGHGQDGVPLGREGPRRRELSLDIARRILDWREKRSSLDKIEFDESQNKASDYDEFRPETAAALNKLSEAVNRDYVRWWYGPILPKDITFPAASRKVWDSFILSMATHVSRKRPVDTFLEFTTNSSSILIVFLNELSAALSATPGFTAPKAIEAYLEAQPDSSLASLLDESGRQRKLQVVADDILESYLDANVYRCAPARIFLRQILANVVMESTLQRCSSDDWINEWIVYLFEPQEPDSATSTDSNFEIPHTPSSEHSAAQIEINKTRSSINKSKSKAHHARTVSRAEEAMQDAMREAQRLTQMIAEEEARRRREQEEQAVNGAGVEEGSDSTTTHGVQTPTSSQSDLPNVDQEEPAPVVTSLADSPVRDSLDIENSRLAASLDGPHLVTLAQTPTHPRPTEPVTLTKANISIFDDSEPGEVQRAMKSKPTIEYLIQIEPADSNYAGWMIPRSYADFEKLHEVLRRIATITGVAFNTIHPDLPPWKNNSKYQLREGLERYLINAVKFEQLAESEGMKRFLDKDKGMSRPPKQPNGFLATTGLENVGKGVLDVLSKAPKNVAGGGKAVIGGVTSVFANGPNSAARRRQTPGSTSTAAATISPSRASLSVERGLSPPNSSTLSLASTTSANSNGDESPRKLPYPTSGRRSPRPPSSPRTGSSTTLHQDAMAAEGQAPAGNVSSPVGEDIRLPPLPSEISDDYGGQQHRPSVSKIDGTFPHYTTHMSADGTSLLDIPSPSREIPAPLHSFNSASLDGDIKFPASTSTGTAPGTATSTQPSSFTTTPTTPSGVHAKSKSSAQRLHEPEARVVVELFFAVVTSLYTLSSAWQIRLTLLNAAKSFLMRPGNPQLESIRTLIQESFLDANTSDFGVAAHILKLRENSLPTEAELAAWPKEKTTEERERLRAKARALLVKRGMPQALTSVMGANASGEALGKVFDCLQVQSVARGLLFGLMLQAIRAMSQ